MISYGGDYNPEQWPEPVWEHDVELMRLAGVTLVTVGVFAWSSLEPAPGRYTFEWLDRALDLLHAGGIRVALATPTASPPPWFSLAHPQALPVTAEGVRLWHGSRDTYCVHAPAYRRAGTALVTELARRYAGHPALALWHVHNEYGTDCHCELADAAFRAWLLRRYGDLAALNEAWTTSFWSQGYSDWAQVTTPRATRYLPNPTQALDFRRFLSGALREHYVEQRDILQAADPAIPVTTNFAFGGWVPVDVWDWAGDLDLVAVDCYPAGTGLAGAEEVAFAADLARGIATAAGRRPWLLMEQAADLVYTGERMRARPAGELARHSLSHVARGATGVLHFQWRGAPGGAELWHAAMLPHAGPDTAVHREVRELGATLAGLADLDPVDPAQVALVWDPQCWWALQSAGLPARDLDYLAEVRALHSALTRLGVRVDLVPPGADLGSYRLVAIAGLYAVSDADAANLAGFPASLLVGAFSGVVDERLRVRTGGYPGAFRDRLGVLVERFDPLPERERLVLSTGAVAGGWRESVSLRGARVVAAYPDGGPAVTRHGDAWYLSTRLTAEDLVTLLAEVLDAAGVARPDPPPPPGLDVLRRGAWTFLVNHGDAAVSVPADGWDATTGRRVDGPLELPPGGWAVLRGDPAGSG
jgi:beta-galactosidase